MRRKGAMSVCKFYAAATLRTPVPRVRVGEGAGAAPHGVGPRKKDLRLHAFLRWCAFPDCSCYRSFAGAKGAPRDAGPVRSRCDASCLSLLPSAVGRRRVSQSEWAAHIVLNLPVNSESSPSFNNEALAAISLSSHASSASSLPSCSIRRRCRRPGRSLVAKQRFARCDCLG